VSAPATPVVFDVNVLVVAVAMGKMALRSWPAPPPVSDNPAADCIGVINDATEFALWLSPHIWRGTPILRPGEFASRVDAMHRARRRR